MRRLPLLAALALAGCGSAPASELPPPAGPERSAPARLAGGAVTVRVLGRERVLEARDARTGALVARTPAGVGPTGVVSDGANLAYVADTAGGAVLVARLRPELQVVRRVALPGGPYGLAMDDERDLLHVTLRDRDELVVLTGDARPRRRLRVPTVERPVAAAVDPATGIVTVTGETGERARIDPARAVR